MTSTMKMPAPLVSLVQSHPEWTADVLGHGKETDTLGRYGCAVTSLAILANAFGVTKKATPKTMNNFLKKTPGAFVDGTGTKAGVLLSFETAAKAIGLKAANGERVRAAIGDVRLAPLARKVLEGGGLCVFHVDHNKDVPGGDPRGDHFIAAGEHVLASVANGVATPSAFRCVDPTTGASILIDENTMRGKSMWKGKEKTFNVVSVIPVYRAA